MEDELKNMPKLDVQRFEQDLNAEYIALTSGYNAAKTRRMSWYKQYRFQPYGNEVDNQSMIVDSTIFNAIEWMTPALIQPFVESEDFINITPEGADVKSLFVAELLRELLTYQLRKRMDFYLLMHDTVKTFLIYGEAYVKALWRKKGEGEPVERPDFACIRPSSIRYDWECGDISKSRTVCHEEDLTETEIRRLMRNKTGLLEKKLDQIFELRGRERKTAHLQDERINSPDFVGEGGHNQAEAKGLYLRREHWTDYDIDGDGTLEPVMAVFIDNCLVQVVKNPYPFKRPPFFGAQCVRDIEGNPAFGWAEVLADIQKYRTAILRLTSDNLNSQHNGMYEVDITNVDEVGRALLTNAPQGSRLPIPVRKPGSINPITGTGIASQTFNVWELLEVASENRAGFTRYSQGLDSKSLNQTATGITSIMQRSDMRMWELAKRLSETLIKPMARMAISMNQSFLPKQAIQLQFGLQGVPALGIQRTPPGQWVALSKEDLGGFFGVSIDISIGHDKQETLQKLMEFAQYFAPMLQQSENGSKIMEVLTLEAVKLMGLRSVQAVLKDLYEGEAGIVVPLASQPEQGAVEGGVGEIGQESAMPQEAGGVEGLSMVDGGISGMQGMGM